MLLMTQLCPRGQGWHRAMGSWTAAGGQDFGSGRRERRGGRAGQPHSWGYLQGGSGGFLSPEQASPRDRLMAVPPLGKQGGADEREGFFFFFYLISPCQLPHQYSFTGKSECD